MTSVRLPGMVCWPCPPPPGQQGRDDDDDIGGVDGWMTPSINGDDSIHRKGRASTQSINFPEIRVRGLGVADITVAAAGVYEPAPVRRGRTMSTTSCRRVAGQGDDMMGRSRDSRPES